MDLKVLCTVNLLVIHFCFFLCQLTLCIPRHGIVKCQTRNFHGTHTSQQSSTLQFIKQNLCCMFVHSTSNIRLHPTCQDFSLYMFIFGKNLRGTVSNIKLMLHQLILPTFNISYTNMPIRTANPYIASVPQNVIQIFNKGPFYQNPDKYMYGILHSSGNHQLRAIALPESSIISSCCCRLQW